jgi:hypothetical protein
VRELRRHRATLFLRETDDAQERFDLPIVPQAEVGGADASLRNDGGRFDDDQRGAADGARAVMHEMPVAGQAVGGRILAHGGNGDAIAQGEAAQGEGFEQMSHGNLSGGDDPLSIVSRALTTDKIMP